MTPFADKVVLITGGTAGIGRATALAFARAGAAVVVAGRRAAEGAAAVAEMETAGGRGRFVRADVAEEADIARLVEDTLKIYGRLDFAFNNAGIHLEHGPITTLTSDVLQRTLAVNVGGVALCLKHQIPALLASGGGVIVNNASILGLRPLPNCAVYNASKAAVISLSRSAALENARAGLRINTVCPAVIETDMTAALRDSSDLRAQLLALHPLGRFGTAEEVAGAVLYLCSPAAAYATGVNLTVDGGYGI
ncbi:MAG: glucose 1-dehydrogenase [Verrucomicrobia bacterium]|nr:glucose 1-dehydrogenase [Verrucomicrobiota bacterium]